MTEQYPIVCVKCNKLVDKVILYDTTFSHEVKYQVQCHGDLEMGKFATKVLMVDGSDERFYRVTEFYAFRGTGVRVYSEGVNCERIDD